MASRSAGTPYVNYIPHDSTRSTDSQAFHPSTAPLSEWLLKPAANHTSYLAHYARQRRLAILKHDSRVVVAVTKTGQVAGIVTYSEINETGPKKRPSLWQRCVYALNLAALHVTTIWQRVINGEDYRKVDARMDMISVSSKKVFAENPGHPGVNHYSYVAWLGVDPQYQGQGLGGKLLQYGIDLGLPVYLEASEYGFPMYHKKGFQELGPRCEMADEDGNVIESIPTMLHPGKQA